MDTTVTEDRTYFEELRRKGKEEFFKVSEEDLMRMIGYSQAVDLINIRFGRRVSLEEMPNNTPPTIIDENGVRVRKELISFLKSKLGDRGTIIGRNYKVPESYQGHEEKFRKEFWDYLENSA